MTNARFPVLFLGHGSPMNALADNAYTRRLAELGRRLPRPKAVLCISAHWQTQGAWVTHMPAPRTIHDFGAFPPALFAVQYPAPGHPAVAERIRDLVSQPLIKMDDTAWGLDHGTWSVMRHVYPDADVPVLQLSLNDQAVAEDHFHLGRQLQPLRDEGVLIIGSGNIVHNLRRINWDADAPPHDWAVTFDTWVKEQLVQRRFDALCTDDWTREDARLSIPTSEHYLPLLYVLGATQATDDLHFIYEGFEHASLSMRCFGFGNLTL